MTGRWRALAVLFSVRVSMAFQFQAVAALSPTIMRDFNISVFDLGLLIGLYLSPGILLAIPGGGIGKRYGDKPAVLFGLALMVCGGAMMAMSPAWEMQVGGRLIAGFGGVILNVLMSKMVTDWFAGKEIATAMGIFVNSWPVGIALALLVLPPIAETFSLTVALFSVAGLALAGFALLAVCYQSPDLPAPAATVGTAPAQRLVGIALVSVIMAGAIWGLYNAALSMIFGFGPAMLVERGMSDSAASSMISVTFWLVAVTVPLGGFIADRTGRPYAVLLAGLLLFAVLMLLASRYDSTLVLFIALGFAAGLPAGPIMSLPSRVLQVETRAIGMGVFFTVHYLSGVLAPLFGGQLADTFGGLGITFDLGAGLLVASGLCLWFFDRLLKAPATGIAAR